MLVCADMVPRGFESTANVKGAVVTCAVSPSEEYMFSIENAPAKSKDKSCFARVFSLRRSQQIGLALKLGKNLKLTGKQQLCSSSCTCAFITDEKILVVSAAKYKGEDRKDAYFILTFTDHKTLKIDPAFESSSFFEGGHHKTGFLHVSMSAVTPASAVTPTPEVTVVLWNPKPKGSFFGEENETREFDRLSLIKHQEGVTDETEFDEGRVQAEGAAMDVYRLKLGETGPVCEHVTSHKAFHTARHATLFPGVAGVCCAVSESHVAYAVYKPIRLKRPKHLLSKPLPRPNIGQMIVRLLPEENERKKILAVPMGGNMKSRVMRFKLTVDPFSRCCFSGSCSMDSSDMPTRRSKYLVSGSMPCITGGRDALQDGPIKTARSKRVVAWDLEFESEIWSFEWGQLPAPFLIGSGGPRGPQKQAPCRLQIACVSPGMSVSFELRSVV